MKMSYIKKRIFLIFIIAGVIIFTACAVFAKPAENPHNKSKCEKCHADEVSFEKNITAVKLINDDGVTMCLKCHEDILNVHHPLRVQVNRDLPDYLPVGKGNSVNCLTCHDLHSEDTSNHLVRTSSIGNYSSRIDICYDCHQEDFKELSPHNSESEGLSCLTCHRDTPSIRDTRKTVTLVTKNIGKMCNFCHNIDEHNHPLNVDTTVDISSELPRSADKKVVCITCHDPHGTTGTINFLREKYVLDLEFGKYENPHQVKEYFNCMKCHVDVPKVNDYVDCRYQDDFILVCYNCHGSDAVPCHPVNIKLTDEMVLPAGFPLNDDGLVTCVTCHNPDCSGEIKIEYQNFRMLEKRNCPDCHDFSEQVTFDPHKGKGKMTKECFYCHKRDEEMANLGIDERIICIKCHKYKQHPERGFGKRRAFMTVTPPDMYVNRKKQITCSTCHDPHDESKGNYKLRIFEEEMTACEKCHRG